MPAAPDSQQQQRMPVLIARHAERVDYAFRNATGSSWQATAERPWDTPITGAGVRQANALGCAIKAHCAAAGLVRPPGAQPPPA